ncbi:MAG: hypothetical protein ABW184_10515 [Sphingobium sp.]
MATYRSATRILIESRMKDALDGDPGACFDLGVAHGDADPVQAHIWFNLAALGGYAPAESCRARVARQLSARQIAEARRRTRALEMSHIRQVERFSAVLFA